MNKSKNSLIAALLMGLVFVGWVVWQQSYYIKPAEKIVTEKKSTPVTKEEQSKAKTITSDSLQKVQKFGSFSSFSEGSEKIITIETDLYTAKISSKGVSLVEYTLKNFKKWDKVPTQLIKEREGQLFLIFRAMDGTNIDSRKLFFDLSTENDNIVLSKKESKVLKGKLEVEPGKFIEKEFVFKGNKYDFDCNITLNNLEEYIPRNGYNLCWEGGLAYQEKNSVDESGLADVVVSQYGKIEEFSTDEWKGESKVYEGTIDYAAIKLKYFGLAIMPQPYQSYEGYVDAFGKKVGLKDKGFNEVYDISFRIPYKGGNQVKKFNIYLGPLDYNIIEDYKLGDMVSFGWRYGIRQIGEYFILPLVELIYSLIGNWGISLIIFAFIMKALLYPFSVSQMRSASKMKLLQPEIQKVRDKFADDNTTQQREVMKLYGEYGINPASGCLPLLLQMPILFALFAVLRNTMPLRQAEFIWWINDLSAPDIIFHLGFSIFGISSITGLALLMGITMFFQQKLTVTDPRQKSMIYIMPVMFTLMFAYLPSGLNLYYFIFNILSIAQQIYMNKFATSKVSLEEMKKSPKKESWMQRKMREAQEMAEQQQRAKSGGSGSKNVSTNKDSQSSAVKRWGSIEKHDPNWRKNKKR